MVSMDQIRCDDVCDMLFKKMMTMNLTVGEMQVVSNNMTNYLENQLSLLHVSPDILTNSGDGEKI